MTTTQTILKRSSELPTPAAPERKEHAGAAPLATHTSVRDIFDTPEIADRVRLCRQPIVLDAADQEAIKQVWELKRSGSFSQWNLNGFLKYLVPYFSSKTIKGTIELLNGTLFAVGKPFWLKTLGRVVDPAAVTPEILNFCTPPPRCFELWITLPAALEKEWNAAGGIGALAQLSRFRDIVVYLFAVQALPELPANYVAALHEFNALYGGEVLEGEEKVQRLAALREVFQTVSRCVSVNDIARDRLATVEIFCSRDHSFKVTFAFSPPEPECFRCNDFRLELFSDLEAALRCPPLPWECLHNQLVHRLEATKTRPCVGRYWAHLTQGGPALMDVKLRDFLREPPAHAFAAGMKYLPPGGEALVAYYANAVLFLGSAKAVAPPGNLSELTPMGDILSSNDVFLASSVLQVIGTLQSCFKISLPSVPQCRKKEIVWKANAFLHLVLPSDFEGALAKTAGWLKQDPEIMLNCLSNSILALFPCFYDVPQTDFQPQSDWRIDKLYFSLRTNSKYFEAAIRLYFLLQGTGWKTVNQSDVIDLPNFIGYAVAADQLDLMLQSLERVYSGSRYASLLIEVQNRIKDPAYADRSQQACIHELLVCRDSEVLKQVWKLYRNDVEMPFLLQIAPSVPDEALSFALNRVCFLCRSLPPSDSYKLLTVYLNRLLQQGGSICVSYKPKLLDLLTPLLKDPTLRLQLLSNRLISAEISAQPAQLLACLRASMTEPALWWGHFLTVRQLLPNNELSQELAGVFQAAIRKWDLTAQDGYAEIYQTIMAGVSDVSARLSIFIHSGRCAEDDVMNLPDYIVYGIEKGQLKSVLESLGRVYNGTRFAPLFAAIRAEIAALRSPTASACRQICAEQFRVCEEPNILAAAWAHSEDVQFPFLRDIAPRLGHNALPFAAGRIAEISASLSPSDRFNLLCLYINLGAELIALLKPLLEDPELRLRLLAYPSVMAAVGVSEASLVENLRAAIGKPEPSAWWSQFLALRASQGSAMESVFQDALRRSPGDVIGREGFAEVYTACAKRLFDQRDDAQLVSLLRLLPVGESNGLVHPWFQALIERNIQEKRPVAEWTETLAAFREAKAVDRAVVLNLLAYLIGSKAAREVHQLCALLRAVELPRALDYFMAYYSSGLTDGVLIDEMQRVIGYFSAAKDPRIAPLIHAIASRLKKDDPLWTDFAELYGLMVNNGELFLEDAVQLLERLAADPPLQCFRTRIKEAGQRLKKDQKFRVAKAYAVAFGHLPVDELLGALPNGNWLMDLLRRNESLEEFTRIFLHVSRGSFDVKLLPYAAWAAPHMLAHPDSPLFAGFERYCVAIPTQHLDTPEWRPIVTRLVDRNPELLNQKDSAKAKLFKQCQTKVEAPKPAVVEKEKTVPDETAKIRLKIRELLAKKPVTIDKLLVIVEELAKLPEEYLLWQDFFKALPGDKVFETHKNAVRLLKRAWQVWLQTHPAKDFQEVHGMDWISAVRNLLRPAAPADLWITFLVEDATGLLEKMDIEACKQLTGICLELAIVYSWNEPNGRTHAMIAAVHRILANAQLQEKFDHPGKMLSLPLQARLFLVLAGHPEEAVHQDGENWVTGVISAVRLQLENLRSEGNRLLFKDFCARPFIPRAPGNQLYYMKWLEDCWELYKQELTWGEACDCLKTVCQLGFDGADQDVVLKHITLMHKMWESLVMDANLEKWQGVAAVERGIVFSAGKQTPMIEVTPGDPNRFSDPTVMLIDRTMRDIESPKEKAELLLSLRRVFYKFGNAFTSEQTLKRFRLRFCTRVLSLASCLPEKNEVFSDALNDLSACLHEFVKEATAEREECLQTFIAAMPYLLDMAEPDLIPKIRVAIEKIMNIRWVVDTTFTVPYGWIQLLGQVTFSVLSAKPEREKAVAEAAYQIFMTCIHPYLVFSRKSDVPNALLISQSTMAFGLIFMTRSIPDCLTDKEWKCLIQAIYIEALKPMIFDLLIKKDGETLFLSSQAVARLIRYSDSFDPLLVSICQEAAENHIPPVDKELDYPLQLECRIQWILAMSALAKRCNASAHDLAVHKILLTSQLAQFAFECMTDENYADITDQLIKLMNEDLEVAETILSVLPGELEEGRTSFCTSMAVARIIRSSPVANSQLILLCMTAVKFNIPPIADNEEYVIQAECRVQWILAMSALEKRCQERPMELVEQKILMIAQLVAFAFECITDENYADIAELLLLVMREDLEVAEAILSVFPDVFEEGRTTFGDSMVVARIIRCSTVANSQLIQLCSKAVKFNIPSIADNDGYVIQAECRAQWIMAMSALEKRCQERPMELVEQKIALARDLTRICLANAKDESSSKFVVKLLMEIMLSDLDVAEAINAILTVPSPSPMTPHIALLKSQVERTIERLRK